MKSIKLVLALMLSTGLATAALLCAAAWWSGERMQAQARKVFVAKDVTADILPPPMYLLEARLLLSQAIEGSLPAQHALQKFDRLAGDYHARVEHWKQNPPYGLERHLLGTQHAEALQFLQDARAQVLEPLASAGGPAERAATRAALPQLHELYERHRAGVDATVAESSRFADANVDGFDAAQASARRWGIGMLALALAVGVLLYLWARQRLQAAIAVPLRHGCEVAECIAAGDLTRTIEPRGRDEAAELLHMLQRMQQSLRSVVSEVRNGVDSVATASAQIAQGNGDLSRRTEQQASSLQLTAASMQQMTSSVRASADSANEAHRLAAVASSIAGKGGDLVQRVVATMNEIHLASRRIADITGVIDGIAFQTNILALNAAVEAARAGEQGRGFAVVASEVRSLAQRSAEAAREIKQLIGTSVERIDAGSAQANDAGATMAQIVAEVQQVSVLIGGLASSSDRQTDGITQVNQAVAQLDRTTQQNAALVEQSAAAAESLREQARRLAAAVSAFRLEPAAI